MMRIRILPRPLLLLCVLGLVVPLGAQKPVPLKGVPPPPAPESAPDERSAKPEDPLSFRSFSRMVLVDVVVRDGDGKPVPGLKAEDFELLEDGQPQKVISFTHEASQALPPPSSVAPALPATPEDVVSNQDIDAKAPPSMIVLDLLNTPSADRPMAQDALVKFLKQRVRRGETIAIFVLGTRLELVQDFTRNPEHLAQAAQAAQRSGTEPVQKAAGADAAFFNAELDFGGDGGIRAKLVSLAEAMYRNEKEVEAHRTITRVNRTLESMRAIARYSARHPGRKSVVWLSAGFPFFLLTDMGMTGFETEMRQTSNLLASAQVAVYPVDVRGLVNIQAQPFEDRQRRAQVWNPQESVDRMRTEAREGMGTPITPQSYMENKFNFNQSQDTMKEIADLTGGTAYLNRNDLDVAIGLALDENRNIYTLGYYPSKKEFNNRFRRIKVRLKGRESASLRYRRGYYATGFSIESRANSDLITALENDPAVSTQIPLVSRVLPTPPRANTPFNIQLFVQGGHIHYTGPADRSSAFLDFAVVAVSPDGTPIARTFRRGELKFKPQVLAKAQQSGFIYNLPVNLPAGEYRLRAGVRDSFTGRIGTVEIPVVVK